MDIADLPASYYYMGHNYRTLNVEEQKKVHFSLLELRQLNCMKKMYFWGRIYAAEGDDYYIAYGYTKNLIQGKVYFYSQNQLDWFRLPRPRKELHEACYLHNFYLRGDPAFVEHILDDSPIGDGFEGVEGIELEIPEDTEIPPGFGHPTKVYSVKEEDRLAWIVHSIQEEAAIVPRGAIMKTTDGRCAPNPIFCGLTKREAADLTNYVHNRPPRLGYAAYTSNEEPNEFLDYSLDFLDPIYREELKGKVVPCWSLQTREGETMVILRNLWWPGAFMYHKLLTNIYGWVYMGHGMRNHALAFMVDPSMKFSSFDPMEPEDGDDWFDLDIDDHGEAVETESTLTQ